MQKLSELKPGESAKVQNINAPFEIKRRLLEMGFTPRTTIYVIKEAPLSDPVEYSIRDFEVSLRKKDAAYIEVEKED